MTFSPDTAKGNTARINCTGPVRAGRYELRTSGVERSDSGPGVPPGWYKVSLFTKAPGQAPINVDAKYTRPETTPIEVEGGGEPTAGRV